jgi:enoyl-CoA hydratase/carnithine racemase
VSSRYGSLCAKAFKAIIDELTHSVDFGRLALQIAQNAPIAVRAAKEAVKRGMIAPTMLDALEVERDCYARTLPTEDRLEGLAAFREGRLPIYKGR